MTYRIAFLTLAALGAAALPHAAAAADYYDEGRGALGYHAQDDDGIDADGPGFGRRPSGRRVPGPVVYDERGPERHPVPFDPARGGPVYGYGGPVTVERPGFGYGGRTFGPEDDEGPRGRPLPRYRAVAAPLYGEAFDGGFGRPDSGCTVQRAESTTPAGWRKIVTHRTCYRR